MKRRTLLILISALLSFLLVSCGKQVAAADTKDGVTVELYGITFNDDGKHIQPAYRIRNNSGEDIAQVQFETTFYDASNQVLGTVTMGWMDQVNTIGSGKSIECTERWYPASFTGAASESIQITEVKTSTELPPDRVPSIGEYLYEALGDTHLSSIQEALPVKIEVGIDQGGWLRTATFEEDDIKEAVEAFRKIKIGKDDAEMVTDNYNYFAFWWEDGTSSMIRLNLRNLEVYANGRYYSYELENLDEFWNLVKNRLADPYAEPEPELVYDERNQIRVEYFDLEGEEEKRLVEFKVSNESDRDLTMLRYEVQYYDAEGNLLHTQNAERTRRLKAGSSDVEIVYAEIPVPKDTGFGVRILDAVLDGETTDSEPLKEGAYLYESLGNEAMAHMKETLPVFIEVYLDEEGNGSYVRFEEAEVQEAVDAFTAIKIGKEEPLFTTDSDHFIDFFFDNGEEYKVLINNRALCYPVGNKTQLYQLDGIDAFMNLALAHRGN